jgi:exonuclease SbcC
MHLHSLTLQALGPFSGRHTIDFAELGASGIFLLEGPTGAGKSTIIDALVFALYGKVASKEASEDRLRSAHATPETETFVDVVLESGSGIYRIRRSPRYERPKKSGRGTTTQQPAVKLWRLSSPDAPDDGELMSSRLDEVGLEVQLIIGLDRAQFVQTVVLPQGEFAGFLRANPEDRRGLLQKVFGTEVYEQLQQRLERMRAEVGRAADDARQAVGQATAHFLGAADIDNDAAQEVRCAAERAEALLPGRAEAPAVGGGPDGEGAQGADGPGGGTLLSLVRRHVTVADEAAEVAAVTAGAAAAVRVAAQRDLDDARVTAAVLHRRTQLRAELADLLGGVDQHQADRVTREAAQRARVVLPLVVAAERARADADAARDRAARCRHGAPVDLQDLVDEDTDLSVQRKTLTVERDRCTAVRATLDRLVALEETLPRRRREVGSAEEGLSRLGERVERLVAERAERPDQRAVLAADLAAATQTASGLAVAEHVVAAAEGQLAAAQDVVALTRQVTTAQERLTDALTVSRAAGDRLAELQQARIRGIAGELAAGLVTGEPCVVCGGMDHPKPAALQPGQVTVEDVRRAEEARAAAERAVAEASGAVSALVERLGARREATGGQDVDAAQSALVAARAVVTEAQQAARRRSELDRELEGFDAATAALETTLAELRTEVATHEARLTARRTDLARDEHEVSAAYDGADSVQERATALDRRADLVHTWCEALGTWEEACLRRDTRADELEAALGEHGFADGAAVRAAHLAEADLQRLERRISQYGEALARVQAGLAEPEVLALPESVEVDVTGAEARLATAEADASRTAAEEAALRRRAASAAAASAQVRAAVHAYRSTVDEAGPVIRMANLAAASGGDNALRLTLATYVLARRFEDVVAAANSRLVTMSDGRYELVRSTEREDVGSRKTGLAMKVVDHRTESERDPRTLSGGETFYVSLCLALGLADVVTAEAGGIDLGTLFVDEGFGTLDAETLDVVLAELGRLRDGGRVVGVVSHVEALKSSIAERIEVRRCPDGSSTLSVRA